MRSDAARQRAGSVWSADFFLPPQVSGGKIALGKNPRGARGNSFGLSIPDFESSLRLLFCHMFFAVVIKNTFCACALDGYRTERHEFRIEEHVHCAPQQMRFR